MNNTSKETSFTLTRNQTHQDSEVDELLCFVDVDWADGVEVGLVGGEVNTAREDEEDEETCSDQRHQHRQAHPDVPAMCVRSN